MKKIVILVLGLFLVSGLFAEWKKVEIPAKLATVFEEAYDNENCRITKLTDGSIEVWFQKDGTVVVFVYDENLWNELKENENTNWISVSKLMTDYETIKVGM